MNCPNCSGNLEHIDLTDKDKERFAISRCANCGGFWLDTSELRRITQQDAEEIDLISGSDKLDDYGLSCPKCFIPLEEYQHPSYEEMVLQRCPDCQGMWLKRGQIAQYLNLKQRKNYYQPDDHGALASRDRVLVSAVSVAIMAIVGVSLFSYKTGNLQLAADSIRQRADLSPMLTIAILAASLIIFFFGLFLALWRKHRTIKLLGWSIVVFSIMILIFLAYA